MGRVDAETVAEDSNADDPFARYLADEYKGIAGVEAAAEHLLRGRRGQVTLDRKGRTMPDGEIEAQDGRDVTLTLHAELQRRLYRLLKEAVLRIPESSGGVIVVLGVDAREVLALVSYPSYDPGRFDELYPVLRDDTERLPLRFRAVAGRYAPGSSVKPLVCLEALMSGQITLDTREECTGYLFEGQRDRWRCWKIHGTDQRKAHGAVNVVEALTGSCNVFMYRLGEKLGVDRLCRVFDMVGVGRPCGIGLPEEARGINPTPEWLMRHKNASVGRGTPRIFAIGQGEIAMTPVQVANLMATYADGKFRPVTLIRAGEPTPQWTLPARHEHLLAIRRGMYGVVNDPTGTAYKTARFENDRYVLCGKTGSATVHPWPTSYRIPYVDEHGEAGVAHVPAGARGPAVKRFKAEHPAATFDPSRVEVASRWPPNPPSGGDQHSHAWFGGFLQAIGADGRPDWSVTPRIAFAVLIEFGGSGGRTSGPLAKDVAAELLTVLGPDLDADYNASGYAER
jgi:penicillin-binding protein 2